jgi:FlaG/FlaF family flagellin (archaellin)
MKRNEVSPVIGVTLLVAITVLIAAMIAAAIFNDANDRNGTRRVAVTANVTDNDITFVYQGGPDDYRVRNINISFYSNQTTLCLSNYGLSAYDCSKPSIGANATISNFSPDGYQNHNHVWVTVFFTDGEQRILMDTYRP